MFLLKSDLKISKRFSETSYAQVTLIYIFYHPRQNKMNELGLQILNRQIGECDNLYQWLEHLECI